jgi:glucose-1-phosphatase
MHTIKNLLFDLGNVLFDIDERAAADNLAALADVDRLPVDVHLAIDQYDRGNWSTERFINYFLRFAKPGTHAKQVVDAWNSMMVGMRPEMLIFLGKISSQYPTYLLSNINELHYEWFINHMEKVHQVTDFSERFFQKTYYSHLIGRRKPDHECFEFVVQDAGFKPGETLFIDDKPENTGAAATLGIQTLTLLDNTALQATLDERLT